MNLTRIKQLAGIISESTQEVHFSPKAPGQLGDILILDATDGIAELAKMLGIPDGWKLTQVGSVWAAFNSGDRLAFFTNQNDFDEQDDEF